MSIQSVKVSVIIAVYNAERFLRQCLDSVAGQTLRDIEIICVNDGSTDGSLAILQEYEAKDGRFRVFTKENEGLGGASARNYGLEKARGTYVSILDSDDFFEPHMLESLTRRAEETAADIVVCAGVEYDDRDGSMIEVPSILNPKVVPNKPVFSYKDCPGGIYQLTQGMAWNKLYRRSFLKKRGIRFQRIKFTDDAYFTFAHMVLAERIAVVDEVFCYYRQNSGTSQTEGLSDYPDSAYLPYITLKASLIEWGIYETVKRSFVNCAIAFMRYFYDKIGRFEPFEYLHDKYQNKVFDALDISGHAADYFYDGRTYLWYRQVSENTAGALAFKSARAHGSDTTTGILRFPFPYDSIPHGSKIAIIGARVLGKHLYSQALLRDYCDVVLWADEDNPHKLSYIHGFEDLKKVVFDFALIAYAQQNLIDDAVAFLKSAGVPDERIIFGGTIK
jgi:glycosyltransferase involved in cell wall biosynthesis